jgi:hypothetical protein
VPWLKVPAGSFTYCTPMIGQHCLEALCVRARACVRACVRACACIYTVLPQRDEVTGEWRKLHNEELRVLYPSPGIIRIIKSRGMSWAGHVARGKRPLGRPRRWWVDNIRMDLGEVRWGDVNWIGLAEERNRWRALVNSVLNLRVP